VDFNKDWLTVIVPTYNRPLQIRDQIERLLSFPAVFEIIVIDDCSDQPLNLRNKRVSVTRNSRNMGEAESINIGYQRVKTKYFCVLSDDDYQDETWVNEMRKAIAINPNYLVYVPQTKVVDSESVLRLNPALKFSKRRLYGLLKPPAFAGSILNSEVLFEHSFVELRPSSFFASDFIQWLELGKVGKFLMVPTATAKWFKHEGQQSQVQLDSNHSVDFCFEVTRWFSVNRREIRVTTRGSLILRYLQIKRSGNQKWRAQDLLEISNQFAIATDRRKGRIALIGSVLISIPNAIFFKIEEWMVKLSPHDDF